MSQGDRSVDDDALAERGGDKIKRPAKRPVNDRLETAANRREPQRFAH